MFNLRAIKIQLYWIIQLLIVEIQKVTTFYNINNGYHILLIIINRQNKKCM